MRLALVGNQNCGKTTLYNALSGRDRRVGNFPGVTVDAEACAIKTAGGECELVDLPGVYSLRPYSEEERVTREYILNARPDGIINVMDATCPERGLYLTSRILELGIPTVVALNMIDEAKRRGGSVDTERMEALLGVPVRAVSARSSEGVEELLLTAIFCAGSGKTCAAPMRDTAYGRAIVRIEAAVRERAASAGIPPSFAASLAAEGDADVLSSLALGAEASRRVAGCVRRLEREVGLDVEAASAAARYAFADKVCGECVYIPPAPPSRLDGAALGAAAYPIFALVMSAVFFLTFEVIGGRLSDLCSAIFGALTDAAAAAMARAEVAPFLASLVTDGAMAGVGAVVGFLPLVVTLFFFLSLIEDTGYMARVAFIMDAPCKRLGLSGKSVVPLLLGFGCSVPAVMASRTLPTRRDRRVTALLVPFMSCGAKIPIYTLLLSYFFPARRGVLTCALYFAGVITAVFAAAVMRKIYPGRGEAEYILELPPWRLPTAKNVLRALGRRAKEFLSRAFGIIFLSSVAVWLLSAVDTGLHITYDSEKSILAAVGRLAAPIFAPLGFGDWRASAALVSGLSAKEAVVGTLAVLAGEGGVGSIFTPASAISFLTFTLLYTPCASAVAAIRGEAGTKMTVLWLAAGLLFAWLASFAVYGIAAAAGI